MEFNNIIRRSAFWGLDYLWGAPIRKHFNNIKSVTEDVSLLAGHQDVQLKSLLKHAVLTTDYYTKFTNSGGLEKFPVVNKLIIKEAFEQFKSSSFRGKKLKIMETNGSTGIPFRIFQDAGKRQRVLASLIYFNSLAGYKVGIRHAFFRTINPAYKKSAVKYFMQNEIEFDVRVQNETSFEHQRTTLHNDKDINILIGYSSVLFDLARYVISKGDTPASFGVKGVLCLAESLNPNMRNTISTALGCPVLARYSNQECGVLAYECPTCGRYHLNTASYFFETLDLGRDEAVQPGASGRIVVTDLYNYALPLIRYDTGDIGSIIPSECPQFGSPILLSIEGRQVDTIFDTAGQRLVPWVLNSPFEASIVSGVIKQHQFIQESRTRYNIRLCANESMTDTHSIISEFKHILGANAQIEIEFVDEIPVLNSGKRKYIVNNIPSINQATSNCR